MSDGRPTPVAEGSVAKTPFAHLLVYLATNQLTGTLALWPDDESQSGQDRVLFEAGQPTAARLIQPAKTLRLGLLNLFERQRAPYAFYETNLLGESASIQRGTVDSWSLITESLRDIARDDVVEAVLARFGAVPLRIKPGVDLARYQFDDSERPLIELLRAGPATVDDLVRGSALPNRLGRRVVYLLAITKAVGAYEGDATARSPSTTGGRSHTANLRRTPGGIRSTGPQDVSSVRPAISSNPSPNPSPPRGTSISPLPSHYPSQPRGTSISPLPSHYPSQPRAHSTSPPRGIPARRSLTPQPMGSVRPSQPGINSPAPPAPDIELTIGPKTNTVPAPPSTLSDDLRKRWDEVIERAKKIDAQNYFAMLGVPASAKADDIKQAYFAMAKVWHPDRLPAELAPLKSVSEQIFSYISEAHETLSNPEKKLKYDQTIKEGGGTPATDRVMAAILDSAMQYQRVEVLVKKHEWDEALEIIERIVKVAPDEADYHAMRAFLLLQKNPGPAAPLSEMLDSTNRALELHEDHEKAHYYKGLILKRMGRATEAFRHFRKAAHINPRNVEAAREVRLSNMRGQTGRSLPPSANTTGSGLLDKLFKKK